MSINFIVFERAALIGTSVLSLENVSASLLTAVHDDLGWTWWTWHHSARWVSKWRLGLPCVLRRCCHPVVGRQSFRPLFFFFQPQQPDDVFLGLTWRRVLPLSLPLAYCRGLLLSMLLKLWLRRLRLEDPGLLETPLPAAGTLEGPGSLKVWGRREGG